MLNAGMSGGILIWSAELFYEDTDAETALRQNLEYTRTVCCKTLGHHSCEYLPEDFRNDLCLQGTNAMYPFYRDIISQRLRFQGATAIALSIVHVRNKQNNASTASLVACSCDFSCGSSAGYIHCGSIFSVPYTEI